MARVGNQMQQDPNVEWFNTMNKIGGAVFGNVTEATKDGEYNGFDLKNQDGYDKTVSDKANYEKLYPQSGLNSDMFNNTNIIGLQQGLQMGQNAIGSNNYQLQMPQTNYGYNPMKRWF